MIDSFRGEYRFLSNFYPAPVVYEGINYPSVEHAYQAAKTQDEAKRIQIAAMEKAADAKAAGRLVVLQPDWEDVKLVVMKKLLRLKFAKDSDLAERLLDTGDEELAEGNNWGDAFWGVINGKGKNWLGKLLMKVRRELRKS